MTAPQVSIIILNYNGGNFVLECLESIYKTEKISFEIILIDNDSHDNSQKICKEKFPEINLIQNESNLGMGARTIGIQNAKGEFIVFLDYDTIVEPSWLGKFLETYEKNGPGLFQPKLLEKENHSIINSAGNMINPFGLGFSRGKGQEDAGQFNDFSEISYTSGACTFSSAKIMNEVKKVDSVFFLYHDDLDFGWRAKQLGFSSFYEPKITVYHYGSPNLEWSGKKFYYLERNRWICLKTLYSDETYRKILPNLILFEFGMFIFLLSKGLAVPKIQSVFAVLKLRKEIKDKKEDVKNNRKISDKEVVKSFTTEFYYPQKLATGKKRTWIGKIIENLSTKAMKIIST